MLMKHTFTPAHDSSKEKSIFLVESLMHAKELANTEICAYKLTIKEYMLTKAHKHGRYIHA